MPTMVTTCGHHRYAQRELSRHEIFDALDKDVDTLVKLQRAELVEEDQPTAPAERKKRKYIRRR